MGEPSNAAADLLRQVASLPSTAALLAECVEILRDSGILCRADLRPPFLEIEQDDTMDLTAGYRLHLLNREELSPDALERFALVGGVLRFRIERTCDPLTALLDRWGSSWFRRVWEHRGIRSATIEADVIDFKRINDQHGHAHGDRVLWECGRFFEDFLVRSGVPSFVARSGSDEFVFTFAADAEAVWRMAEEMCAGLRVGMTIRRLDEPPHPRFSGSEANTFYDLALPRLMASTGAFLGRNTSPSQMAKVEEVLSGLVRDTAGMHDFREFAMAAASRSVLPLLDRAAFFTRIAGNSAGSEGLFCFALVDLDRMREINAALGRAGGRSVLERTAALLQELATQNQGFAGRYGGDEFLVQFRTDSVVAAHSTLERLRETVELHMRMSHPQHAVTISVGYRCYDPGEAASLSEVFEAADTALRQAKSSRNTVVGVGLR